MLPLVQDLVLPDLHVLGSLEYDLDTLGERLLELVQVRPDHDVRNLKDNVHAEQWWLSVVAGIVSNSVPVGLEASFNGVKRQPSAWKTKMGAR